MDGWKILIGLAFVVLVAWLAISESKKRKSFERRARACEVTSRNQDNDVRCYRCAGMPEQCWEDTRDAVYIVR